LALFNASDPVSSTAALGEKIAVDLGQLGWNEVYSIRDLWSGKMLGKFSKAFSPLIRAHACGLYRITRKN